MPFAFGTKAETLEWLRGQARLPYFCEQTFFSVADWRDRRESLVIEALGAFDCDDLVVRSSALVEDGANGSMAGAFLSLVGVPREAAALGEAIDDVISSYGRAAAGDQVLIQPKVESVAISGVVMTRDLETGAPYYVINYDDFSGRTDSVTGGAESKTIIVNRDRPQALHSSRMRALVRAVTEIEAITDSDRLDIEFCITHADEVFIFQVRALAASRNWLEIPDHAVDAVVDEVRADLDRMMARRPGVAGATTVFGQMPDWNPAEMIGGMPRPLAYSAYRRLITDNAWAVARARMGYRDMSGHPLMRNFAGQPYIDVRLSLNSFLPADLDEAIAETLVDAQLARLADRRDLHDRIEFAIAMPSLDFAFDSRRPELVEAGLDAAAIDSFHQSLRRLTAGIVESGGSDLAVLEAAVAGSVVPDDATDLLPVLQAIIDQGIIPFAMLARHAFIGVSFLRSLATIGVFEDGEIDRFVASVHTVAAEFVGDLEALHVDRLSRQDFLARYGHLRPGTYDIASPRYDQAPDLYLGGHVHGPATTPRFECTTRQRNRVADALAALGADTGVDEFLNYIAGAIRLRELAKFRFTRTVSGMLEMITAWGRLRGLDREALSYLSLEDILADDAEGLGEIIETGRAAFQVGRLVRLPHLITGTDDVDVIRIPFNKPTFITQASVTAPLASLLPGEPPRGVDEEIVLIESADPGFDWIFSYPLAGLITKFGGANSHMAIRCAEFGVPAAIGCGERLFDDLAQGRIVALDCAAQTVRVVARL
jgi:phosphohistidine swiveling domain-containing protein